MAFTETSIILVSATDTAAPDLVLGQPASLIVSVFDAQSNPIADALIELRRGNTFAAIESTSSLGMADFADLPASTYSVQVAAAGFLILHDMLTLVAGSNTMSLTLAPAGVIQGLVVDAASSPIGGIQLHVFGESTEGDELVRTVTTGNDGRYSVSDLPYGTFAVTVGNGVGINRQEAAINLGSLALTRDFVLAGAGIAGIVVGSDGATPVAEAEVWLFQNDELLVTATTNAEGGYRFRSLVAGSYSLRAAGAHGISPFVNVVVAAAGDVMAPPLEFGDATINGTVTSGGMPIAGASIVVFPGGAVGLGRFFLGTSDDTGQYSFSGLSIGDYSIQVEATDLAAANANVAVSGAMTRDFALTDGVPVTETITAGGLPVSGVAVQFIDPASHVVVNEDGTDANGLFQITDLPAGTYNVLVRHRNHQVHELMSVVIAGPTGTVNLALQPKNTTLSGVVRDSVGGPVVFAQVAAVNSLGETIATVTSSFDGSYVIDVLPPGNYTIVTQLLGYYSVQVDNVSLAAAMNASLDFLLNTAGIDDLLGFFSNTRDIANALLDYLYSKNPEPKLHDTDSFGPLPNPDCDEKRNAFDKAKAGKENKEAAYEAWEKVYASFNTTIKTSGAIFAIDFANFISSIVGAAAGAGFTAGLVTSASLAAAGVGTQLFTVGLAASQLIQSVYSAATGFLASPSIQAAELFGFAGALASLAANFGGKLETAAEILGTPNPFPTKFGVSLFALINVAGNLISTIIDVNESANQIKNLGNTVPDAEDNYLRALIEYRARRLAYDRIDCPPGDPPPPKPAKPGPRARLGNRQAADPNEKETTGVGLAGFVQTGEVIEYTIHFENMATASAAAQQVVVTDTLSANLDLSTIELVAVGFNNVTLDVPAGQNHFDAISSVTTDPNPVQIHAELNPVTRVFTWTITSIDLQTLELTEDPDAGFLPPNDATARGQGFVTFRVRPILALTSGTTITNSARIVFDVNAPIDTPSVVNTIDAGPPSSGVSALPAVTFASSFLVSWAGSDDAGGSGIRTFDVLISDNGGEFYLGLEATTLTSATFQGLLGHNYSFYTVAVDQVGHREAVPVLADATTRTAAPNDVSVSVSQAVKEDSGTPIVFTFTRSGDTAFGITASFQVGGLAILGSDYSQSGATTFNGTSGTVSFDVGQATATVTIAPTADQFLEFDETVLLMLVPSLGINVIGPDVVTGTITNDDLQMIGLDEQGRFTIRDYLGRNDKLSFKFDVPSQQIIITDSANNLTRTIGTLVSPREVRVPLASLSQPTLTVELGIGNDSFNLSAFPAGLLSVTLFGQAGNDSLTGGASNETFFGGDGNDVIVGGAGDDSLVGGVGNDKLDGGLGSDLVEETASADFKLSNTALTGNGSDTLAGIERVRLTSDAVGRKLDAAAFTLGNVTLTGGVGNDTLLGGSGADVLVGADGHDSLVGGLGNDTLQAGVANDSLTGGLGDDSIVGGTGTDRLIEAADANFTLTNTSLAGVGADLFSGIDSVQLSGGKGNNRLDASAFSFGSVTLMGLDGKDTLIGGCRPTCLMVALATIRCRDRVATIP